MTSEGWCQQQGFQLKKGAFGAWSWDGNLEDCHRLAALLFEGKTPLALRRRPQEIAGWPEISRSLKKQEMDTAQRTMYQQEWQAFKVIKAASGGPGSARSMRSDDEKSSALSGLVAALRFRQKSSATSGRYGRICIDLLEQGIKPAISCAFIETLRAIEQRLVAKKETLCHHLRRTKCSRA